VTVGTKPSTLEKMRIACELRDQGLSQRAIASKMKLTRTYVQQLIDPNLHERRLAKNRAYRRKRPDKKNLPGTPYEQFLRGATRDEIRCH
jgi:site-specific recombinase XerC